MDPGVQPARAPVRARSAQPLRFEVRNGDAVRCVSVHGEVDLATVGLFVDAIRGTFAPSARVGVDLGGVTLLDARGVGACLGLQREARTSGCALGFARAHGIVARVLEVLELEHTFADWLEA